MWKTIIFLSVFTIWGCASVQKELNRGNYSNAVNLAVSKLKGKKKSEKDIIGLRDAYQYYIEEQLRKVEQLKLQSNKDSQILSIYEAVDNINSSIKPLLPLQDQNGYVTDIPLIDVKAQVAEYKSRVADQLYFNAIGNLEKGGKMEARKAYDQFQQMINLTGATSHLQSLRDEAKKKGTTYILALGEIDTKISVSKAVKERFMSLSSSTLSKNWQRVDITADKRTPYDYELIFVLDDFVISPEKESSREYIDKKEIEESAGTSSRDNEKIKRKIEVSAQVVELYQFKEAQVKGKVILYDVVKKKDIYSEPVTAAQVFENYASTYKGDKRALSDVSLKRIGGKPIAFPSNDKILGDAVATLKKNMEQQALKAYSNL
jgi:hypothetical protein